MTIHSLPSSAVDSSPSGAAHPVAAAVPSHAGVQDTENQARRTGVALAILRGVAGGVFIAHGAQKLFVWGLGGVTGGFAQMGVPLPGITGPGVAFLEFFGGMALVAGFLTPWVAGLLAITMLGAILMVHLPAGFFMPDGYAYVLVLFAAALALVVAGPGRYSVDALLRGRRRRS